MAVDGGVEEGVVAGRYRLLRLVGQGGMGRVWQAHDEVLDREVAVKEILPIAGVAPGRSDVWERTIREARTAARLRHPSLIRVYDVHFADGRPWIVMEYVAGRSLHATVRDDGPLAVAVVAKAGLALLDGLAAAHAAGVLHRDVTPRNVRLTPDGHVLLGDFGVAVFAEESFRANATREDVLLASPAYVAPERVTAGESSPGTDLWSLGATLYLAVEGRAPYARPTPLEQLTALMREPPDVMLHAGPLEPVISGLLRRDPGDRLTAAKARPLLEAALTGEQPAMAWKPPRLGGSTVQRKLIVAGVAAAVLGAGGVGAWAAGPRRRPPPARPPRAAAARRSCPQSRRPRCRTSSRRHCGVPVPPTPHPATRPTDCRKGGCGTTSTGSARRRPVATRPPPRAGSSASSTRPAGRASPSTRPRRRMRIGWRTGTEQERQLLAGPGAPAGYRRISISAALYQQGAADWEYTFDENGTRWHTLRRNFGTATGHGFVVSWTAPDAGWDAALDGFRTVLGGFDPR
ncbi:protein kinase [Dactylosporangium sp. NPDC000244]|uniref:protein kinase domain-containing protein n=1 Tax=Dactylosporangium sp. NPDC000244 TaxID=3154365 RepID=UPI003328BA2C